MSPASAKSAIVPGCPTVARSGGFPPSSAVERRVTISSPAGRYSTLTFGYASRKPSRTPSIASCSAPDPDAHERDRAADVLAALDAAVTAVVSSAARGDDRECEDEPREEGEK